MSPLITTAPPLYARRSASAVSWRHHIYLFGGVGAGGTESILDVSDELWMFDTLRFQWLEVSRCQPWPSARRCAGLTRLGDILYLFGGSGVETARDGQKRYTFLNDLWMFRPDIGQWECIRSTDSPWQMAPRDPIIANHPAPRYTPVFCGAKESLFLFGGYTEDPRGKRKLNDAWVCQGGKWRRIPSVEPSGYHHNDRWPGVRYGSMSAVAKDGIYVCGGFSDEGDHIDVWRFDPGEETWNLLCPDIRSNHVPLPRYCAATVIHEDRMLLFGGRSRANPKLNFNDLWSFDIRTHIWRQLHDNRTPHRYDAHTEFPAYHAKSSAAVVGIHWYLWGGEGVCGHVSDLWRFDLMANSWEFVQASRADDPMFW